jgi:hypothetical protein
MVKTSDQPLVMAGPVLRMSMLAPKPLPPVHVGHVAVIWQPGDCAYALDAVPNNKPNAASNWRDQLRGAGRLNERDMIGFS